MRRRFWIILAVTLVLGCVAWGTVRLLQVSPPIPSIWSPSADSPSLTDAPAEGQGGSMEAVAPPSLPFRAADPKPESPVVPPESDQALIQSFAAACRERKDTLAKQYGREIVDRGTECLALARRYFEALPTAGAESQVKRGSPEHRERQGFAFVLAHLPEDQVKDMTVTYLRSVWIARKELAEPRKTRFNSSEGRRAPWLALTIDDSARVDVLLWHMRIVDRVPSWIPVAIESATLAESADPWVSALYRNAKIVELVKKGLERTAPYVLNTHHYSAAVKRQVRELYVALPKTSFELADQFVLLHSDPASLEQGLRQALEEGRLSARDVVAAVAMAADRLDYDSASGMGMAVSAALLSHVMAKLDGGGRKDSANGSKVHALSYIEELLRELSMELRRGLNSQGASIAIMRPLSVLVTSIVDQSAAFDGVRTGTSLNIELSASDLAALVAPRDGMLEGAAAGDEQAMGAVQDLQAPCACMVGLSSSNLRDVANRIDAFWLAWGGIPPRGEIARAYLLGGLRVRFTPDRLKGDPEGAALVLDAALSPEVSQAGMENAGWRRFTRGVAAGVLTRVIALLEDARWPRLSERSCSRLNALLLLAESRDTENPAATHSFAGQMDPGSIRRVLEENGYLPSPLRGG